MRTLLVILLGGLLVLGACNGDDDDTPDETPTGAATTPAGESPTSGESPTPTPTEEEPTATPPPPPFEGTTGTTTAGNQTGPVQTLADVRAGRHDEGFDRIVFEFDGDSLPAYQIEYIVPPAVQCGSGQSVRVEGGAVLEIRLRPAQAHNEAGEVTIPETEFAPAFPTLLEAVQTCDFEGAVTWIAGVEEERGYRVLELADPTRLVVDVLH